MASKTPSKHLSIRIPEAFHKRMMALSPSFGMSHFIRNALNEAVERAEPKSRPARQKAPDDQPRAPTKPAWQGVRDIVCAQLTDEGIAPSDMIGVSIEHMGEEVFWKHYMATANCRERMEKHQASL